MKSNPRTALGIFFLAIICFLGFSYFSVKGAVLKKDAVDISKVNISSLRPNMHVTMNVDKCIGYYLSEGRGQNFPDKSRHYLVLRYNKEIGKYDHLIDVKVDSDDFDQWEKLVEDVRNNNESIVPIHIDAYVTYMDPDQANTYLATLTKCGFSSNYITSYSIVVINEKQINRNKFILFGCGILFIILGLLYLNWVYHPFNRDYSSLLETDITSDVETECYDVELTEEELFEKENKEEQNVEENKDEEQR